MSEYESVIITKPDLSKNKLSEITSKVEKKITEFANIIKKEDLRRKSSSL